MQFEPAEAAAKPQDGKLGELNMNQHMGMGQNPGT